MIIDLMSFLEYLLWGLMGSIAHLVVMRFAWDEKTYPIREVLLSIVLAFVLSQANLPNKFTTFGLSFLGVDAIEGFLRRLTDRFRGNANTG
ncbi:MAG: hypothetical protein QXO75_03440 [Nitrososphaerota archaeon]